MNRKRISVRSILTYMLVCLITGSMIGQGQVAEAVGGMFYKADERGISIQMVSLTSNSNSWSDSVTICGGERQDVRLKLYKESAIQDGDVFVYHYLQYSLVNADPADSMLVTITDARVINDNGDVIDAWELNGQYELSGSNDNRICTGTHFTYTADEIDDGYFCATISVMITKSETGLFDLCEVEGELPADYLYDVKENVIRLYDFTLDGTMRISGNDAYDSVILEIKGDCSIRNLIIDCPVVIRRYAYSSLSGTVYTISDGGNVTTDPEYNSTKITSDSSGYSIAFNTDLNEADMTTGEKDEKAGTYDYAWRHRSSEWYREAVGMIEQNRKGTLNLSLLDSQGDSVQNADIHLDLTDYDYSFGGTADVFYDDNFNRWTLNKTIPANTVIDYGGFSWECYDNSYEGDEANTYSFAKSNYGNTNYMRDKVKYNKDAGIEWVAQQLVYPSTATMNYNTVSTEITDELVDYILSDEYSPDGLQQRINDQIEEVIHSYAGYVYTWAIVNEPYYWNEFFQLIYGIDGSGNGITKEGISEIIANGISKHELTASSTNKQKIKYIEQYLKNQEYVEPEQAARIIAGWAETAQAAWDSTITESSDYTSDDLILYINDCTFIHDVDTAHYPYIMGILNALGKSETYPNGKVLVRRFGSQMALWWGEERATPEELRTMLDDAEEAGFSTWITEFCYWLDHPVSDTSSLADYGTSYSTTGCSSKTEEEFIYDYGYYLLTTVYAHPATFGFVAASYPHGQIGFCYTNGGITPMGEAYRDLVMDTWNTGDSFTIDNGHGTSSIPLTYGTYTATITVNGKTYEKTFDFHSGAENLTLTLNDADVIQESKEYSYVAVLYEDAEYTAIKENLGAFASMEDINEYVADKTGYLYIQLLKDADLNSLPNADGILGIRFYSQNGKYTLRLTGENLQLYTDINVQCPVQIINDYLNVEGNGHTIYIGNEYSENYLLPVQGGRIHISDGEVIFFGKVFLSADLEGADLISMDELVSIDRQPDGNIVWNKKHYNTRLIIDSSVNEISELKLYGDSIYITDRGSLNVDSVSGIYGEIWLQKSENGELAAFTVNETMQDMDWQIRLKVFDTLNTDNIFDTQRINSVDQGTVLAYIPDTADESCYSKLGLMLGDDNGQDDWNSYSNKSLLDGRMYYDDGSSVIDHLWNADYTVEKEPTCSETGLRSIHCSICGAVKDTEVVEATGKHDNETVLTKATISANGKITVRCKNCQTVSSTVTIHKIASVKLAGTSYVYTGSAIKPSVTVTDSAGAVINASNYTVTYSSNKAIGTASVKIVFKGNYSGTVTRTFTIVPKSTSITGLANAANGIKLTWSKVAGATGYLIYRKEGSGSYAKVKTVSSGSTVTWTDTGACSNAVKYTYYIVAYTTVDGTVYKSANSAVKYTYYIASPTISSVKNLSSGTQIVWKKVSNTTGYILYRKTGSGSYVKVKTISGASTVSYTDTAAKTNNTKYTYYVVAYKTVSGTSYKSAISKTMVSYYVGRPVISKLQSVTSGTKVTWNKVSGASGYYIYRKTGSGSYTKVKTITSGSTLTYTDTGAKKSGTKYTYYIVAYKKVSSTTYKSISSASKSITHK